MASAHTGDILKVYGPSFNGRTGNFSGLCTDDIVSLQTQDTSVYVRYQPIATGGSIIGHTIYSVGGTEGAGGGGTVSLYCPPNGYAWTYTNISCDGLFNGAVSAQYKVRIGGDSAAGNYGCAAGNITFKNVNLQNSGLSSVFHMDQYCYVKSLTFEDCFISSGGMTRAQDAMVFYGKIDMLNLNRVAGDTLQSVISTNGTSLIDVLNFNGCSQRNCIGLYVPNGGTCNIVNFIGCTIAGVASGVSFVYSIAATTVKEINLIGCNVSGGTGSASFVQLDSMLVGVKISFLNCHLNALKIVGCTVTSAVVDVCLSGCVVDGASNGLVRNDAACTFNITSGGGNSFINSSVPAAVGGGVLTLGLYGWDLPYDVITGIANITLATANGQFIKSTRVGATNLGPAVKAPAGWVALGTGASGANTVIA